MRGLRGRLLTAFVLLAAFSTVATAGLTYRQARGSILDRSQSALVTDFRVQLAALAPSLAWPADQAVLTRFLGRLTPRTRQAHVQLVQGAVRATGSAGVSAVPVPDGLRQRVRDQRSHASQRVVRDGVPWLVVGAPLTVTQPGETASARQAAVPVEVYLTASLHAEQADTAAVLDAARNGALPVALAATLLALLSARRVLLPVRDLGRAAHELADGRLDTEVKVVGKDELADLATTFNRSARVLESTVEELRSMEARARRFAADVSHELRTPLSVMTAVTDVLDEEARSMSGDAATAAALVGSETRRLVRLVEDLLEISRFDAGAAMLRRQDVVVSRRLQATLRARGWQDRVRTVLPQQDVRAQLDARRLDVIVANLVGNALRHGADPVSVTLAAVPHGGLVVEVADSGPGVPQEALPHLFDRFYKAEASRSRSEGSGLGLAIAQGNTRLHGGTLTAANRPEGGAVFTLCLPGGEKVGT
ncbi:two-component sensor histidine kinase [Streptomyces sp. WZ.A104]|uniref:sensor histidine kinase n=1 Tax=Streptomyces sp. WZ.A104 TaxID=2023771 RepID=UPI000BBB8541|nr:HAMP domain-containing sensor histidine kinase [Streptomyces sp. WZ.A104]PCG87074.1 two-component sensor histidine kinase [Streptomyces sp. WZ.A104]